MNTRLFFLAALAVSPLGFAAAQPAQLAASPLCVNGQCAPVISETTYFGRAAYRLTDGKTEAVVVPTLGRVMRYGRVGGANLLWNAPTPKGLDVGGWKNYGGDKTWLSPQSSWGVMHGKGWPPDAAFDGTPQRADVLTGGKLRMVSSLSPGLGIYLVRVFSFNSAGEFVIQQSAVKTAGAPVRVGLWSISQSVPGACVFLPVEPDSAYKGGAFYFNGQHPVLQPASIVGEMLRVQPQPVNGGVKFGVDAPVSALASVRNGLAWVQKSAKPKGDYPDGAAGYGFPVELYINGDAKAFYAELELLGPLVNMSKGQSQTHTVRWSLHDLPTKDAADAQTLAAVATLLR